MSELYVSPQQTTVRPVIQIQDRDGRPTGGYLVEDGDLERLAESFFKMKGSKVFRPKTFADVIHDSTTQCKRLMWVR